MRARSYSQLPGPKSRPLTRPELTVHRTSASRMACALRRTIGVKYGERAQAKDRHRRRRQRRGNHRQRAQVFESVRTSVDQVIAGKGATNYAIGLAASSILQAILWEEGRVLPVSSLLKNYRGLNDVCLSVPTIVNRHGVEYTLPAPMSLEEEEGLRNGSDRNILWVHISADAAGRPADKEEARSRNRGH